MTTIDRTSALPFYFQLATAIRADIDAGRWRSGDRLPSEQEFCERYDLSRSVVRQALATLQADGIVSKAKGRGAFVEEAPPARSWLLQSSDGFFQDETRRVGAHVTSRILRAERERLPDWAAGALGLEPGSDGVILERQRSVEGRLALYVTNHLPLTFEREVTSLGDAESLYERLGARGITVVGGRRTVQAVPATARLSELLDVRRGAALMLIESVLLDRAGTPIDCYRAWVRTDRMRVEIQVTATGPTSGNGLDREILRAVG